MKNFSKTLAALLIFTSFAGCGGGGSTAVTGSISPTNLAKVDKPLDAANCNPGESINPPDKGKTIQTSNLKYTLLDARTDALNASAMFKDSVNYNKVLLVKLAVENIGTDDAQNLSASEVDLTRNSPPQDKQSLGDHYVYDVIYKRSNICVDLAGDVGAGSFPKGKKVVGYYVYGLPDDKPFDQELYFGARYYAPEDLNTGKMMDVAGSFKLQ